MHVTSSYPADLFAATHRGTDGDVAFYRRHCEGARCVLELGCGYGRLLRELAGVAVEVHGLDHDDRMLGMAAATNARLHRGDMTDFDLGRTFDRILLAHSVIYCLPDDEAVRRCLAAARRHLADDGLLLADAYIADAFHDSESWGPDEEVELSPIRARGQQWSVFERSAWDRDAQRIDVTYRYAGDDGTSIEAGIVHRYLLRPQLEGLVRGAGLTVCIEGGFEGEAWSDEGQSWTLRSGKMDGRERS